MQTLCPVIPCGSSSATFSHWCSPSPPSSQPTLSEGGPRTTWRVALTSLLCSVEEGVASCSRALLLHMLRLAPERQRLRAARVSIATDVQAEKAAMGVNPQLRGRPHRE